MAARSGVLSSASIRSFPVYPLIDYNGFEETTQDLPGGWGEPKKRPSDKLRTMVSSALIFLTVVSWADVFQEYLALKEPDHELELDLAIGQQEQDPQRMERLQQRLQQRRRRRLESRLVFASTVTLLMHCGVAFTHHNANDLYTTSSKDVSSPACLVSRRVSLVSS